MEDMPIYSGHLNSEGDPQTELYVPQIQAKQSYGYDDQDTPILVEI